MNATEITNDVLAEIPVFRYLEADERRQLCDASSIQQFTSGEVIIRQGRKSQNLWVLLRGECEVIRHGSESNGDEVVLATLTPYSTFGEMSFFHAAPHSAGVRAKGNVDILRLQREAYDQLIDSGATSAYKLALAAVETMADRLRKMDEWVAALVGDTSREKREWSNFRSSLFGEWNL
ncbi:MAG: cyclic nucleotide-binding domain-containing protein [Pirellulales bacterium]|nr:cyclic nucleotide-binding domain-containing protein [Pirellulales bacterium]